jgi:hypothetical protein
MNDKITYPMFREVIIKELENINGIDDSVEPFARGPLINTY